ncbi:hypothetical protein ASG47_20015 [Devosia sp. Leaf420]|uniref:hypothetical protein n=1 Tax=Devosia sp. Leaf420 TaxID=1736374 RepID=UPI000713861F|nr:hypothetical protein [Devosia sp. Leaf420]KQT50216.1 hypothetical protein ASG47_20015 [Devosia sp. Leaf420]
MVDPLKKWMGAYHGKTGIEFEQSYFLFQTIKLCAAATTSEAFMAARVLWHHAAHVDDMRVDVPGVSTYSQLKQGVLIDWSSVLDDFERERREWSSDDVLALELVNNDAGHSADLRATGPQDVKVTYHPPGGFGDAISASEEWRDAVDRLFPGCHSDEVRCAKIGIVHGATEYLVQGSRIRAILDYLARVDETSASSLTQRAIAGRGFYFENGLFLSFSGSTISFTAPNGNTGILPFKVGSVLWRRFQC